MSKKRLFRLQNTTIDHNRGERHQTKGLMSSTIALHVRFWVIVFPGKTTPWNDQILPSLRNVNDNDKIVVILFGAERFLCMIFYPFLPQATTIFGCCFETRGNVKMAWHHYSGLFRVFCSLEQNVWNTFHVFRNWKSVSIERLLGFILFILIPE